MASTDRTQYTGVVARWESRSGKHYVNLTRDEYGYGYTTPNSSGYFGNITREAAEQQIERRVLPVAQPDTNKLPMVRIY